MQVVRAVLFCWCLVVFTSFSNPLEMGYSYIERYKEYAMIEMQRSGVPASITLAQGLLESNYGTSRLAVQANNHFGIKCKSYWTGNTFFHKDDDYDNQGRLMESCFRAYETDLDSYVDHSNFLKFTAHYRPLFEYYIGDYESWAHGLKDCGYATDRNYAKKLIHNIEQFQLYNFDQIVIQNNRK